MDYSQISGEALSEWREHPVSKAFRAALGLYLEQCKAAALQAWWEGHPVSDAERIALHREMALYRDLFENDLEAGVLTYLKKDDE